jgi:hypothetical protein
MYRQKQGSIEPEAKMKGKNSERPKPIVEVAVVAIALATLFSALSGTRPCSSLLGRAAWVALEALRPVLLAAWRSVPACQCQDSGFLGQVLQIATSLGPLLCSLAGLV